MTKQDILEKLNELRINELYGIECLGEKYCDFKLDGVSFKKEEEVGGEDQGSHIHMVYSVNTESDTFFIKIDGYYSSYDSTEWQEPQVVEPYMKEVRDWKVVNVIGECR
jgi:hypothetical protein